MLDRNRCLALIATVQKNGGVAAFVDRTGALTADELRKAGCRPEEVLISLPDSDHQAFEITETLLRSGSVDVVVLETRTWLTVSLAKVGGAFGALKKVARQAVLDDAPCTCGATVDEATGETDGDCRSLGCDPACLPCNVEA